MKKSGYDSIIGNNLNVVFCTFFMLLPFVQTSYYIFIPILSKISIVWRVAILLYILFKDIFLNNDKKIKIDKLLLYILICNTYMIIPTLINNGSVTKFCGYLLDSVGLMIVIKYLSNKYNYRFLYAVEFFCRSMMYINFFTMILKPDGLFVEDNGYLVTRYLFLGMDNQAAVLVITFMMIIIASEKYKKVTSKIFWLDIGIFIGSIVLIWCGNSIVALGAIGVILIYQKIFNRKITVRDSIHILIVLFLFVVVFQGFRIFSVFIVNGLGKDMTLSGRTSIWSNGIKEWITKPIVGHGFHESEALISFGNVSGYRRGAHNEILHLLLHGGVIYLGLFYLCFIKVDDITKKISKNKVINILILGVLANFIMGIADTYGHLVGLYFIIGIMCYCKDIIVKSKV